MFLSPTHPFYWLSLIPRVAHPLPHPSHPVCLDSLSCPLRVTAETTQRRGESTRAPVLSLSLSLSRYCTTSTSISPPAFARRGRGPTADPPSFSPPTPPGERDSLARSSDSSRDLRPRPPTANKSAARLQTQNFHVGKSQDGAELAGAGHERAAAAGERGTARRRKAGLLARSLSWGAAARCLRCSHPEERGGGAPANEASPSRGQAAQPLGAAPAPSMAPAPAGMPGPSPSAPGAAAAVATAAGEGGAARTCCVGSCGCSRWRGGMGWAGLGCGAFSSLWLVYGWACARKVDLPPFLQGQRFACLRPLCAACMFGFLGDGDCI